VTPEERQKLRDAAIAALRGTNERASEAERRRSRGWELQTSNSFRRIGQHGDGDVLCATTHPVDRHPDLLAPSGVLDYIVAAQPRVVLDLLDYLDEIENEMKQQRTALSEACEAIDETLTFYGHPIEDGSPLHTRWIAWSALARGEAPR
jgi:hypothetical protein